MSPSIKGSDRLCGEVITVRPRQAREWLSEARANRTLRPARVARYARRMRDGEWQVAQPILFNADGKLIDGQHRMAAIVQSNRSQPFLIITGYDCDLVFGVLDDTQPRSLKDWLDLMGEPHPGTLSGMIQMAHRDARGVIPTTADRGGTAITPIAGVEFLEAHPDLREYVTAPGTVTPLAPRVMLCFCAWRFARIDKTLAKAFVIDLAMGESSGQGDPVMMLRNRLLANHRAKVRLKQTEVLALIYKAWNAERTGTKLRQLKWMSGGENPEAFPELT